MKHALSIGTVIATALLAASALAQTPAGPEFQVNTQTTGLQYSARVAVEPDGDFIVVWQGSPGAFGQRYAASGAPRGGEFLINSVTTSGQGNPSVAVGRRGDFVVVWGDYQGGEIDVRGRRFDASGNPLGADFPLNTYTTGYQYAPRVGLAADGRFVAVWMSQGLDGSDDGIVVRRFDASGNPIGAEFVVNTYTTGGQQNPDISMAADGSFVAVWQDSSNAYDGDGAAVVGQRFDASGNPLGGNFQVNSYTTANQTNPSVSLSPAGGFVVSWESRLQDGSGDATVARRFGAAGNALGNDFVVNTYTTDDQYRNQVSHDASGNFVVTWTSEGQDDGGNSKGCFAQRFSASGARRGGEFRVNTHTTDAQMRPSVASDAVGNFVVAWNGDGQDGDSFGTFAQRFGGLVPEALAVDNGFVLDPGETMNLKPTWRNVNGATQVMSGALGPMTGPAGAVYTIVDGLADYGAVADGAAAQCADCYLVSVSNPATRPAAHWDASVVETMVPDVQGQQKKWILHVGRSFDDVPVGSPFYPFVEALFHHGVTGGCGAASYCPASGTTRDQMAVFVLVAKEGLGYVPPACATPVFGDVPATSPFCRWVEEAARRGIASGCGGGNYCPGSPVTREQMAVFVLRALDPALQPPACTNPLYGDVPAASGFCRWIEELTRRGVVSGCGGGNYCPAAAVTREQMGVFMGVTFALTLYGL
jgi:hypothetical protein